MPVRRHLVRGQHGLLPAQQPVQRREGRRRLLRSGTILLLTPTHTFQCNSLGYYEGVHL